MKTVITVKGPLTVFSIQGQNISFKSSPGTVNFTVSGTGPQGPPAQDRKFNMYRLRQNNNTNEVEIVTVLEQIEEEMTLFAPINSSIQVTSNFFNSKPYFVNWTGGQIESFPYKYANTILQIQNPSFVFTDFGSGISDWAWLIIEDLTPYVP